MGGCVEDPQSCGDETKRRKRPQEYPDRQKASGNEDVSCEPEQRVEDEVPGGE
jgi:hypothetical protein